METERGCVGVESGRPLHKMAVGAVGRLGWSGEVGIADTFLRRLFGMARAGSWVWKNGIPPDVMVFGSCRAVHTVGMRGNLDIAFVDGEGIPLRVEKSVGSGRFLFCRNAFAVVERLSDGDETQKDAERENV